MQCCFMGFDGCLAADKLIPQNTADNEADAEDMKSKLTKTARWVMKQTIPT